MNPIEMNPIAKHVIVSYLFYRSTCLYLQFCFCLGLGIFVKVMLQHSSSNLNVLQTLHVCFINAMVYDCVSK